MAGFPKEGKEHSKVIELPSSTDNEPFSFNSGLLAGASDFEIIKCH